MISWKSRRQVNITKLRLPGDMRRRMESARVKERAHSIDDIGMLHCPIVRWPTLELICGKDRVAALMLRGSVAVEVDLVECSDEEAKKIELAENYHRRHNEEEQRLMMTKMMADYTEDDAKPDVDRKAMASLMEHVPGEIPVKGESEKRQGRRSKATVRREGIKTMGMAVDDEWMAGTQKCLRHVLTAEKRVRAAMTALGHLKEPYPRGKGDRLRHAAKQFLAELKAAVPSMLCPHCKNVDGIKELCVGCQSSGFITKGQEKGVPRALMHGGSEAEVQFRGETMRLSRWMVEHGPGIEEAIDQFADDPGNAAVLQGLADDDGDWL